MSVSPASEPAPQVPYFFLSYAHTPLLSSRRGANINLWVERLFDDLCGHLLAWTALRRDSDAGFMDRDIRSGDRWPDQLAEALATCRVFVPLYSPRYFASVECGKEWSAFQQRLDLHPEGGAPTAIVPALWSPMREPGGLPECAHDIQYDDAAFGPRYRQEGFYGLMKVTSMRSHYQRATLALARRIMEAAERLPPVRPSAPPDYASLTSAFHGEGAPRSDKTAARRLRLTIAAPDLSHLPADRRTEPYGHTPQEWNPYYSEDGGRPLAMHAMELALSHGLLPEIGSLSDHADRLADGGAQDAPSVMIVDPWITAHADSKASLGRIGRLDRRPVPVVPWNLGDPQTAGAEHELKRNLRDTLPDRTGPQSVSHVTSLEQFRRNMPKILGSATRNFFRTTPTYPPPGTPEPRPRLKHTEETDDKRP